MRRIDQVLILTNVTLLLLLPLPGDSLVADEAAQPPNLAPAPFSGKVVGVKEDQVTVAARGNERTFYVNRETMILLNNVEASLEDLKPGHLAVVTSLRQKEKYVAKLIVVRLQM